MTRRFRNWPLFWKILVPFMTLMIVVGSFGAFLIVRTLSARAQNNIDQDLARRSLEARSTLRDRELSLLESATLAANVEGMARAVETGDRPSVGRLAESVLALKSDLGMLAITDGSGRALAELVRSGGGVRSLPARSWSDEPLVSRALAETTSRKHAGLLRDRGRATLIIASPICRSSPACSAAGVALVGVPVAEAVAAANVAPGGERASLAVYDTGGALLASAGSIPAQPAVPMGLGEPPTRVSRVAEDAEVATFYTPYVLQGRPVGRLAVSVSTGPALSAVRDAAVRLGLILLAAMGGVVAVGALVSRRILAQVKPLVDANRALGAGDLSARVPVVGEDELGELARGVNKMAEQLQASYETLEARVAQRTEEVHRLLEERTEFFASISHELRTPLAVIIAQAELMRDPSHAKTSAWTTATGVAIGDSAGQLLSVVNDILDLARAEAGGLVLTMLDLNLADVVNDVAPTIERLAHAGEIAVAFDVPASLTVRGDPVRLKGVLLNLVDNAVKYTPPRGEIVVAGSRLDRSTIELSVSDTGIGIPSDIGDRIFEPFYRVRGSEPQRGQASSGLGLALARRIIEAHGGTISYSSTSERGTTFRCTLPAGTDAPARAVRPRGGRARSKGSLSS